MTGYFFELGGKMGYAAIVHLAGDFGKTQFIVDKQFLYPFDFMFYNESFDGMALCFGEDIGHVGIIVVQLLAEVCG